MTASRLTPNNMNPHPRFHQRQRPKWWPENEAWPPTDRHSWRRLGRHNPFFRRLGCLFFVFNLLGFLFFASILGLALNALGIIQISTPQFQWFLPLVIVVVIVVITVAAIAARNLRRVSRPLDELVDASNKIAEGDFSVRVEDERGPSEVRVLLRGFNSMAERLQTNDQQRRAMLADVSHELRTPITVIQGNVEGILDGLYPADEARLKSIMEETQILSRLVDDLRTLALAESGSLKLMREATDLGDLIRDTVAGFESQALEKEVRFELSLANAEEVNVDPLRLREVLSNLIGNALRYTPAQGVVKVGLTESSSDVERDALSGDAVSNRSVLISVEDSGVGIPSADLPHVFERFYKSSDSGGMGLGLSIAKYLVEAHGGKIWAESVAGRGTTITIRLPKTFAA